MHRAIREEVELKISKYKKVNMIFSVVSAIAVTLGLYSYLQRNKEFTRAIYNSFFAYSRYEPIDDTILFIGALITSIFVYYCFYTFIDLIIGIYTQNLFANELKVIEMKIEEKEVEVEEKIK